MYVYELVSENLTQLGGPMGTERTTENWRKLFSGLRSAQQCALEDWHKTPEVSQGTFNWIKKNAKWWHSPDLRWVMYHIRKIKVHS